VKGDPRNINFPDEIFDVVFLKFVMEHIGGFEDQKKMADEIRRVGKRYFVQSSLGVNYIKRKYWG